ncbi:hypothetical protein Pcinc_013719 [Petrolisthes cinctipes]|uniref:Endonuclease-reverse transcriptase n=1 Tax=Petrolisthes cinctipes TaxID=88211 RepID=A0AAE1FWD5_PETCI|nr:hypothetical protein Pcinc_013719 [Petrolisthes cinctipes]
MVQQFAYLEAIISDHGSKPEILARAAQTMTALSKLKPIWKEKNISVKCKVRLLRALVLSIFLYACETWTLTAELQRRIQTLEMRCYRTILGISYLSHISNDQVLTTIQQHIGPYDDLLTIVKERKLRWYGHVRMVLQKQFSRGQWREGGGGEDRGRSGATTSRSGQRKHSRKPRPWRTTATGGGIWSTTHLVGDPTTQPRVKGARRR